MCRRHPSGFIFTKTPLLYRMKRLFQLLDLENETPFTREFLIRLIFMYHPVDDIT